MGQCNRWYIQYLSYAYNNDDGVNDISDDYKTNLEQATTMKEQYYDDGLLVPLNRLSDGAKKKTIKRIQRIVIDII